MKGNISITIKKFFTNKNTVTVVGILLGLVVLYVGYNYRIKSAINPISVPYATQSIPARTKIAISFIIGDVIKKLIETPNGTPASIKPINTGIDEQLQNGVIAPNIEAKR